MPYGELWECEECGRRWNTGQIPAEEYWGLMRDMRRMRLVVIAVALGTAALFALLGFLVDESILLLFPVVLAAWFLVFMPWWRRKIRTRARALPKWQLHPASRPYFIDEHVAARVRR